MLRRNCVARTLWAQQSGEAGGRPIVHRAFLRWLPNTASTCESRGYGVRVAMSVEEVRALVAATPLTQIGGF
jgi:hypothetical protein